MMEPKIVADERDEVDRRERTSFVHDAGQAGAVGQQEHACVRQAVVSPTVQGLEELLVGRVVRCRESGESVWVAVDLYDSKVFARDAVNECSELSSWPHELIGLTHRAVLV